MKQNKRFTPNERQCICKKYDDGKSPSIIARELEINVKTVISVINLYKTSGRIYAKTMRTTRKKKLQLKQRCL